MNRFDGKCLTETEDLKKLLETAEKVDKEMTEWMRRLVVDLLEEMLNDMVEWLRQKRALSGVSAGISGIIALFSKNKAMQSGALQLYDGLELLKEKIANIETSRQLIMQHAPSVLQSMDAEELFKLFDKEGLIKFLEKLVTTSEQYKTKEVSGWKEVE
jgi:hypothetical protein